MSTDHQGNPFYVSEFYPIEIQTAAFAELRNGGWRANHLFPLIEHCAEDYPLDILKLITSYCDGFFIPGQKVDVLISHAPTVTATWRPIIIDFIEDFKGDLSAYGHTDDNETSMITYLSSHPSPAYHFSKHGYHVIDIRPYGMFSQGSQVRVVMAHSY